MCAAPQPGLHTRPYPQPPVLLLTCPHETLFAIAVVDIALLLWKKKRRVSGSAAPRAGGEGEVGGGL